MKNILIFFVLAMASIIVHGKEFSVHPDVGHFLESHISIDSKQKEVLGSLFIISYFKGTDTNIARLIRFDFHMMGNDSVFYFINTDSRNPYIIQCPLKCMKRNYREMTKRDSIFDFFIVEDDKMREMINKCDMLYCIDLESFSDECSVTFNWTWLKNPSWSRLYNHFRIGFFIDYESFSDELYYFGHGNVNIGFNLNKIRTLLRENNVLQKTGIKCIEHKYVEKTKEVDNSIKFTNIKRCNRNPTISPKENNVLQKTETKHRVEKTKVSDDFAKSEYRKFVIPLKENVIKPDTFYIYNLNGQ